MQGETDLDDDGDTSDRVVFVYDDGEIINTRLQGGAMRAEPGILYFSVPEDFLERDVNGDGDIWDRVVHIYDQPTGRVLNTNWVNRTGGFKWRRKVLLQRGPADPGVDDQIFDLDTGEREPLGFNFRWAEPVHDDVLVGVGFRGVPHVYDPETGALSPLGIQHRCQTPFDAGRWAGFLCSEWRDEDLNGDGDAGDMVPVLYDAENDAVHVLEFDVVSVRHAPWWGFMGSDGYAAILVSEWGTNKQDLNGDGDLEDDILFTLRFEDGLEITNTGESVEDEMRQAGPLVLFHGKDSDFESGFLTGFDAERGRVIELGGHVSISGAAVSSETIAFDVSEAHSQDLNGDGDTRDHVTHYYDRRRDRIVNTKVANATFKRAAGRWLALPALECEIPSLNKYKGRCLVLVDTHSRRQIVHPSGRSYHLSERIFAVQTRELISRSFRKDFNGDGDTQDEVLFMMELPGRKGR